MDVSNVTIPLAFAAGFLSFISPCVLPLVPVYLGYLTGSTIGGQSAAPNRLMVMGHALFFILGFSLIFVVVFGAPVGVLGNFLRGGFSEALVIVGGAFLILFGLHMGGVIRFLARISKDVPGLGWAVNAANDWLDMLLLPERRLRVGQNQSPSYPRSLFIGMTFAAGWTPCIGPLLGLILSVALNGQDFWFAISMLLVYSLGLAVPFLLTALLLTSATSILKQINRYAHTIEIVSAVFLVTIGVLLMTNQFEARINPFFSQWMPDWLLQWL